jgi:hypothetical protein
MRPFAPLLLCALVACDSPGDAPDPTTNDADASMSDTRSDVPEVLPECLRFSATGYDTTYDATYDVRTLTLSEDVDFLEHRLHVTVSGSLAADFLERPTTYRTELHYDAPRSCGTVCVTFGVRCATNSCEHEYLATDGYVVVDSVTGGIVQGRVIDLRVREYRDDQGYNDWAGSERCVDEVPFTITLD